MRTPVCLFCFAALAYPQQAVIQVATRPSSVVPTISCGANDTRNFTQNATVPYTVSCVYPGRGFTSMSGGSVSGQGGGACVNGVQCQTSLLGNSGPAPLFSGQAQDANDGVHWNAWVNIMSRPLAFSNTGLPLPFCGTNSQTQGDIKQVTKPTCPAPPPSPIIIDPTGEGFFLTDNQHGVVFRETTDSPAVKMSWTDPAHHNAWLVRPNADGSVTSLEENMFGNLSPQPASDEPNGYAALGFWAQEQGCGKVTRLDATTCPAVWRELRLWQDGNQDGVAQPEELHTLEALGVHGISLKYHEKAYVDEYGNQFRYVSKIDEADSESERCYDVFLIL